MIILAIETSCDETSIALVKNGREVLAIKTYSQLAEHEVFYGVVPEIASRMHVEIIFPLIEKTLKKAQLHFGDIDAIAVTQEPGLAGSLLVGFTIAKTLAYTLQKPLILVNHLWAHFYAVFLENHLSVTFPYVGLLVSGGHTLLTVINSWSDIRILGSTIDDSVGEAYDKVAKMMNLPYPGGVNVDNLASKQGCKEVYPLPNMLLNYEKDRYNFSYSGLKTAVKRFIEKKPDYNPEYLAYSFQKKAIDILVEKSLLLCKDKNINSLLVAGGVASNTYLRKELLKTKKINVYFPEIRFCSDNAGMIGGLGYHLPKLSQKEYLHLDIKDKIITYQDKQNLRT